MSTADVPPKQAAEVPEIPDDDDTEANENEQEVQVMAVLSLRPTQLAVGFHAAREKADRIAAKKPKKQEKYFRTHPVPVVVAPDGGMYIIDHHHLCVAALQLRVSDVYVTVRADWSDSASADAFWRRMDDAKYVWLHDNAGQPIPLEQFPPQLPKDATGLKDDPHRSLAAIVRRNGGFQKVWTPFSEFHWANFFRPLIEISDSIIQPHHVDAAMKLAKSQLAVGLPGHTPDEDAAPGAAATAIGAATETAGTEAAATAPEAAAEAADAPTKTATADVARSRQVPVPTAAAVDAAA